MYTYIFWIKKSHALRHLWCTYISSDSPARLRGYYLTFACPTWTMLYLKTFRGFKVDRYHWFELKIIGRYWSQWYNHSAGWELDIILTSQGIHHLTDYLTEVRDLLVIIVKVEVTVNVCIIVELTWWGGVHIHNSSSYRLKSVWLRCHVVYEYNATPTLKKKHK